MVEFVPSPKSQNTDVGVGAEVFVKLMGLLMQPLAGLLKPALIKLITTALGLTSVVIQPVLLVTLRVTVKFPCVV